MSDTPVLLYVEDDPLSRQVMEMFVKRGLRFEHLTIFEDSSNFQARLESLSPQPDIIFLDIHMKPYDGFEVLSIIRGCAAYCYTPVIAITASVMNEEIVLLQQNGFDGALSKPIDQTFFHEFIRRILKGEKVWHIA